MCVCVRVCVYIYIYIYMEALVMDIIIGNELSDPCSNPGQSCLYFT